jgi:hypothetical protein
MAAWPLSWISSQTYFDAYQRQSEITSRNESVY